MLKRHVGPAAFVLTILFSQASSFAAGLDGITISGPLVHANLAIYLLHGGSTPGPVPIPLQEAFEKKLVRVNEIGRVDQLTVDNLSSRELFIQSGDIVTGGRQDRVIISSLVLPPGAKDVTLAVFCVEPGRWTSRTSNDEAGFVAADAAIPSATARTILTEAAIEPAPVNEFSGSSLQQKMWDEAATVQTNLGKNLHANASDPASPTSLALSLNADKLQAAEKSFVDTLAPQGLKDNDVVGFVVVVNGHVSNAEIYPSHALFRAMWEKELRAGAAEAIETETGAKAPAPSRDAIQKVLDLNAYGPAQERPLDASNTDIVRIGPAMQFIESRRADASWVLRSYVAKAAQ
ncbi:MAG: DUF6569 family protein [Methylovirgula sp.]|jgi:hypothetical protein